VSRRLLIAVHLAQGGQVFGYLIGVNHGQRF
jgi:hypothetical protein